MVLLRDEETVSGGIGEDLNGPQKPTPKIRSSYIGIVIIRIVIVIKISEPLKEIPSASENKSLPRLLIFKKIFMTFSGQ